jgi:L,D-peptidoglycan transpeptidase YkuD (ErfK/YbiS/YcfS/YnhG family)
MLKRTISILILCAVILTAACAEQAPPESSQPPSPSSPPPSSFAAITAEPTATEEPTVTPVPDDVTNSPDASAEPTPSAQPSVTAGTDPNGQAPPTPADIPESLDVFYEKAPSWADYYKLPSDTEQLIVVESSENGMTASVYFFEQDGDGAWAEVEDMRTSGWGGTKGIGEKSKEGDKITPIGQYAVGEAFYIGEAPETGLDSFEVTDDTYWVDDPESKFYNMRVEGVEDKDWNSAEHMNSYVSSYKYGFVIGYNTEERTPGAGSAVFFHIGDHNTAGCVAVSEESVLSYLAALKKELNPYILIV